MEVNAAIQHERAVKFDFHTARDELLFRSVLALPKASSSGLDSRKTFLTRSTSAELPCEHNAK